LLVGGFNPSEKYDFVNGKDDNPYIMENEINVLNHQSDYIVPYGLTGFHGGFYSELAIGMCIKMVQ